MTRRDDMFEEEGKEEQRQYTLSISEENRERSFEIEDERWSKQNQIRDWIVLGIAILFWLGTQLIVYFLEPGLK